MSIFEVSILIKDLGWMVIIPREKGKNLSLSMATELGGRLLELDFIRRFEITKFTDAEQQTSEASSQ